MGFFWRRKREEAERLASLTSLYVVDACARMGGDPVFVRGVADGSDPEAIALYIIGEDEVWANYNAVQERKRQIENGEDVVNLSSKVLERIAFSAVLETYKDKETGKVMMVYAIGDGQVAKFSVDEVIAERKRQMSTRTVEKVAKYDELEDIARVNDCIRVIGHLGSDEAVGTWVRTDGKLVRKTLGAVRAKRIELGLEEETSSQEDCL